MYIVPILIHKFHIHTFHIRTSLIFYVYIYICVYMLILIHIRIGDLAERLRKHDTTSPPTRRARPSYAYTQVRTSIYTIYKLQIYSILYFTYTIRRIYIL